jgi:serine protease Do
MSTTSHAHGPARIAFGLAVVAAICLATMTGRARAQAPRTTPLERVSDVVQPSIVALRTDFSGIVRDRQGDDVTHRPIKVGGTCSGFIVDPTGFIVTAGQCLDLDVGADRIIDKVADQRWERNRQQLTAKFPMRRDYEKFARTEWTVVSPSRPSHVRPDRAVRAYYGASIGEAPAALPLPARVQRVRSFVNGDVGLVKIEANDLPALQLANSAPLEIGATVASAGFAGPLSRSGDPRVEQGSISATEDVGKGLRDVFALSPALAHGMVGGPTVNLDGQVVGVTSSRRADVTSPASLVSPASEVRQVLSDEGVRNDIGRTNREYRKAVDAFLRGDKQAAIAGFDLVLKLRPQDKLAQSFRARALRLAGKLKGRGISLLESALLGLIAVPPTGGGVAVVRRKRRRRRRANRPPRPTVLNVAMPALVALDGDAAGQRFPIDAETVIGRHRADVTLDDAKVSRRHAVVRPVGHGLEIEDVGSANGTSVNGVAVHGSQALADGDVVQVGGVRLAVHVPVRPRDATVLAGDAPVAQIVLKDGPHAGRRYPLSSELVIGRHGADVDLDDPQVSRRHAIVRLEHGELVVEDLRSTNGTRVNGDRVEGTRTLRSGDTIAIGPFALEIDIADDGPVGPGATVTAG